MAFLMASIGLLTSCAMVPASRPVAANFSTSSMRRSTLSCSTLLERRVLPVREGEGEAHDVGVELGEVLDDLGLHAALFAAGKELLRQRVEQHDLAGGIGDDD